MMEGGLDELVEALLTEIAFSGNKGIVIVILSSVTLCTVIGGRSICDKGIARKKQNLQV